MSKVIGLKKEPYEILIDIESTIKHAVNNSIGSLPYRQQTYNGSHVSSQTSDYITIDNNTAPISAIGWPSGLQEYIQRCVLHAVQELLENLYTEKDLEKDLNIK